MTDWVLIVAEIAGFLMVAGLLFTGFVILRNSRRKDE